MQCPMSSSKLLSAWLIQCEGLTITAYGYKNEIWKTFIIGTVILKPGMAG